MKLTIVNGSPRGRKSNSDKILQWLLADIKDTSGFSYEKVYAIDIKDRESQIETLKTSDSIVVIFPLYTDCMPGITKDFFENMENCKKLLEGKTITFIVHSGFPEAIQSRAIEKYNEYFAKLMKMNYLGTIIMGGSEALSAAPDSMFKKKITSFKAVGRCIIENKALTAEDKALIGKHELLPGYMLFFMKRLSVSNFFWNSQLKKNNAFDKRFDKPYK
jgi:putative NADPH-quinone reductase